MKFSLYRYNPEQDQAPRMQTMELPGEQIRPGMMLLDALLLLKAQDETLAFRRSCGEGVCGSDGVNVNGRNALACVTPLASLKIPIEVRPLPGMPVIRDLIVDLEQFYHQYREVKPYLITHDPGYDPELDASDEPWLQQIPCEHGHLWPFGGDQLAVSIDKPSPVVEEIRRLSFVTVQ